MNVPASAPASRSRITTKLPIKLYISNTTTLIHEQKQSWEYIQTGSHQLPGPQAGLLLPVKFYMAGTQASLPGSPVSQETEE